MWYTYFLKLKNGSIYVGSTDDLKRRIFEHNSGKNKSTKGFLPAELFSYIAVKSEKKSRSLEKYFKTGSGKAILKKRILSDEA